MLRNMSQQDSIYRNDTSKRSMKRFFLLALYISLALRAGVYVLPVIDTANLQQQVQNEYQNLTQYLSTVSNTLKSAQQLEQQVLQLGQYANVNNLPGVSTIGQIVRESETIYSQATGTYCHIQRFTNPPQFPGQLQP